MNSILKDEIKYYTFDIFPKDKVLVACFTRLGGASTDPWASLNLGGTVGDKKELVIENKSRLLRAIDRKVESVFDVWQVHGTNYVIAEQPREPNNPHQKADIIFTENPELTLLMRFADCVPIIVYDEKKQVISLSHAGWKGSLDGIAKKVVEYFIAEFGSDPKNLLGGIGPSIGPDHYAIGNELLDQFTTKFPDYSEQIIRFEGAKPYLNLWKINELILKESGVDRIECANMCTACNLDEWYSHRAEHGMTGRFGVAAALLK